MFNRKIDTKYKLLKCCHVNGGSKPPPYDLIDKREFGEPMWAYLTYTLSIDCPARRRGGSANPEAAPRSPPRYPRDTGHPNCR